MPARLSVFGREASGGCFLEAVLFILLPRPRLLPRGGELTRPRAAPATPRASSHCLLPPPLRRPPESLSTSVRSSPQIIFLPTFLNVSLSPSPSAYRLPSVASAPASPLFPSLLPLTICLPYPLSSSSCSASSSLPVFLILPSSFFPLPLPRVPFSFPHSVKSPIPTTNFSSLISFLPSSPPSLLSCFLHLPLHSLPHTSDPPLSLSLYPEASRIWRIKIHEDVIKSVQDCRFWD